MIVLLSYSMNCWSNNQQLFYGAAPDSVLISYDDLRNVNSKLIELNYEKDINKKLKAIINNDKIIINSSDSISNELARRNRQLTKQRNVYRIGFFATVISVITLLIK